VTGIVGALVGEHFTTPDVRILASGLDAGGRRLPSNAWMALRRLGWSVDAPQGARVNDRVVRMAQEQAGRVRLHLPTLRILDGRVYADIAFTHAVPTPRRTGHTVALGVDWGLNTLLSAGALRRDPHRRITALGAGGEFRAGGVLAKQHRLLRLGERLHTKAEHYQRVIGTNLQHPLAGKLAVLREEIRHVAQRRTNLNAALAWSAARWVVDQAIAARASVIYVEDLRSMEARGMGRTLNTRLSQQVRSKITDRMRHIAAETGIAVVSVPARNTSRPAPRRRRAPSPTRPPGQAGKRPEGHAPTDRRLPRAAHRHQNVTTISTPTGHRPRGATLGADFTHHAHATPPRWETIPDTQLRPGSLS